MKLLFFTDTHIRGSNPVNRIDSFSEALENKFLEIVDICNREKVDFVLHGGDFLDRPDVSISVINRFIDIMQSIEAPIYLISGNHDIYGHNPKTIDRTILSLLNTLDFINILNNDEIKILEKDGLLVQLTGQPYIYGMDEGESLKYYSPNSIEKNVDYSIHMVHGMLLDKPFIKEVPHTTIEDIKDTKADIILSGHYHSGFKRSYINGTYFINPGSIVRISNSLEELKRSPKVVLINLDKKGISFEEKYLKSAKKGEEVLDRKKVEEERFKQNRMVEFKQIIDSSINFEKVDINDVIIEVSRASKVEDKVIREAIKRISEVQMERK